MPSNIIQSIIRNRANVLFERYNESRHIDHSGTKGDLREAYLMDFLEPLLPRRFSAATGFITDALGTCISPQIDLIFFDEGRVVPIELARHYFIVPIESVIGVCEIKSSLNSKSFDQIVKQIEAIRSLKLTSVVENRPLHASRNGIPTFIFSYDSDLSEEALKKQFNIYPSLISICIASQFLLLRRTDKGVDCIRKQNANDHWPLMVFVGVIEQLLNKPQEQMIGQSGLRSYLQANELDPSLHLEKPQP